MHFQKNVSVPVTLWFASTTGQHLLSHCIFNISQENKPRVLSPVVWRTSKIYSAISYLSFFISHELTEIKSCSEREGVQQITAVCQCALLQLSAYFDPAGHTTSPAGNDQKCMSGWINWMHGRSFNLGRGWSVRFAVWWVEAPTGAVSAEISSAAPAICHYLIVNPSL